jgi:outer membrane protein assembly factor BamB
MANQSNQSQADQSRSEVKLRLLPGIVILIIQWILWLLVPALVPGDITMMIGIFGGELLGIVILIWWVFFSRAPGIERWGALILIILAVFASHKLTHVSITTAYQGMMFFTYIIPFISLAFVIWTVYGTLLPKNLRRITMVLSIIIGSGVLTLLRSDGISGATSAEFKWRWAKTSEEILMEQEADAFKMLTTDSKDIKDEAEWPGFRGPNRDNVIHGIKINTDWSTSPPVELWRRQVGPGCSSFAVHGDVFFTQEQLGEDEIVSCYNLSTGEPIWKHSDKARFWDSHAGAGPRSTPTLKDSLVFTLGATGILNVLNAKDGSVVWSRNAATDINSKLPGWGYASSPLVVDSVVIVAISGSLVAYDIVTSDLLWKGPDGGHNYSSPHLMTIDGVKQVLMMSEKAASSFVPETGELLWERPWENGAIIQPAVTPDGDLIITEGYRKGIHRINVSKKEGDWNIEEKWFSKKIKPDFNDQVIHKDHLYGIDGISLSCIDLSDGTRKWKYGRYGGQILLLTDQDLLLLLSEKGELVLVEATPVRFNELSNIPAIEGKTWNHPVLVNDVILVRNTQEMVAYQLDLE